jgi:sarcosine oxidase subunit beta
VCYNKTILGGGLFVKKSAEAIIIGGGIQGLSLAYYLTRKGIHDLLLLEMNTLGSGSSGRSAAIIGHAFQTEHSLPLTRWSFAAFHRFEEELGTGPDFESIGVLLLAGARSAADLRARHSLLRQQGLDSQVLAKDDILRLTPGLNLSDIELGVYNPGEGAIDPHAIMMAYAQAARRRGATLVEGVRATGLSVRGGRVVGDETSEGPVATACVVNAAGFRARQVAAWAGLDLPITNVKRHIFVTGPLPVYAEPIPFTYEVDLPWYMRREGPGLLLGMGNAESDEEEPQVDWAFLDEVIEHSIHRAPPLEEAGVKTAWAGLRPLTPDDDPILGPVPNLAGYWNDCGWGGHGIMHAPVGGAALAEWIVDGAPVAVDIRPFVAERFVPAGAQLRE